MDILPKVIDAPKEEIIEEEIMDLPIVEEKEVILPEEIFKKMDIATKTEISGEQVPVIKKVRKKRTMTPEALEKLALARQKALAKKKENKEARAKGTMPTPTQVKEQKIEKEKELMRPTVNNITHETKNITNNITHDDIRKIALESTQQALDGYEQVRKERKVIKKQQQEIDNQRVKVAQTIQRAMGKRHGEAGFFNHCFQ